MSEVPVPTEDGEQGVVTMLEVVENSAALEADAAAVLGATSDTVCSFSQGYVTRQPLYAVEGPGGEPAGVCLACSYHCHEGAALVELYTKRLFRCDCGTQRLPGKCKLGEQGVDKSKETNNRNKYNQNFKGLYCSCSRPYPDPEYPDNEDCMIQCVICEDWFHGKCLCKEQGAPDDDKFAEMVCEGCVGKYPFLLRYKYLAVKSEKEVSNGGGLDAKPEENGNGKCVESENADVDSTSAAGVDSTSSGCKLKMSPTVAGSPCSLFLPLVWRSELCKCETCLSLYTEQGIPFITSMEDTVQHYEQQATQEPDTMERGMEALGQMDRVRQVEAIQGYNNMKENLMEYLAKFRDSNKVVREEDIREFFEGMKSNKKMKIGGAPPSSCK